MTNIASASMPRNCPCGASCAPTNILCPKCMARLRWRRREAWRASPQQRSKSRLAPSGRR